MIETITDGQYKYHFTNNNKKELKRIRSILTKEPGTIKWISSFEPHSVFYDVGANIGTYTIYSCKRVKQVVAFEPHLGNCASLLRNVGLNKAYNVQVISSALHNKSGFFDFNYYSTDIASSNSQLDCKLDDNESTELKYATTIDELVHNKIIETPTHIKIDVDGNEIKILQGMKNTLKSKCIKSLQVELGQNKNEASLLLSDYGYSVASEHYTHNGLLKLKSGIDQNAIIHNVIYI